MTDVIDPIDQETEPSTPTSATHLEQVRDLVLRAYPEVVPELVTGATIDELFASVEPASAAYRNLVTRLESVRPQEEPARVPAGTITPVVVNLDALSPAEKVRRGLVENAR